MISAQSATRDRLISEGLDLSSATYPPQGALRGLGPVAMWALAGIFLLSTGSAAHAQAEEFHALGSSSEPALAYAVAPKITSSHGTHAPTSSTRLAGVKRDSGLTWEQIAGVFRVSSRAVYLWREGGGMTDAHMERLTELRSLVASLGDTPQRVREELTLPVGQPQTSLLDALVAGANPEALILRAPWRAQAESTLHASLRSFDQPDEYLLSADFVFLGQMSEAEADAWADRVRARLSDQAVTRAQWETSLEEVRRTFMEASGHVGLDDVAASDGPDDDELPLMPELRWEKLYELPLGGAMFRHRDEAA